MFLYWQSMFDREKNINNRQDTIYDSVFYSNEMKVLAMNLMG